MCGIAGWIDKNGASSRVLEAMQRTLIPRGPDDSGMFQTHTQSGEYSVALAHQRLAIIDLHSGHQPMQSPDKRCTLIFNGEIYNYKELRAELMRMGRVFTTSSDTEVLLIAYLVWGKDCVKRLRGMFAFALWDEASQELLLARDPFGKKPLFLWQEEGRLLFASEIKALLAHPAVKRERDPAAVASLLQYRYVPAPHTLFKDITKLLPAHLAVWREGKLHTERYTRLPDATAPTTPAPHPQDAVRAFAKALEESVRLRMNADVPFGAFLSGGLDSSAIVALMSRESSQPINTFSMGFAEAGFNELAYAREIAQRFHTNHHERLMTAADIITTLPDAITAQDAPLSEPTDIAVRLLSQEAVKSVRMVLSGEGADELLAGYPKHLAEPLICTYHKLMPESWHSRFIAPLLAQIAPASARWHTLTTCMELRDPHARLPRWFGALTPKECSLLLANPTSAYTADVGSFSSAPLSALRRQLYFDQTSWLPDNLLERGDRMTMSASLEARMPFMDTALAATIASLPDSYRLRGTTHKWLLREAMRGLLPNNILTRPKIGFRVPVGEWFRTHLQSFLCDHLLSGDARTKAYLHRPALLQLLDEHNSQRRNHEKLLWTLLNLELFERQYGLS